MIFYGNDVCEAIHNACEELSTNLFNLNYTVLEKPQKSFWGKTIKLAKIEASVSNKDDNAIKSESTESNENLRECPDCNKMISKRAEACPNCGCPIIKPRTVISNVPKCPTCSSTDIKRISAVSKVGSVAMWGVLSVGKISKTYHCNNCKAEW